MWRKKITSLSLGQQHGLTHRRTPSFETIKRKKLDFLIAELILQRCNNQVNYYDHTLVELTEQQLYGMWQQL